MFDIAILDEPAERFLQPAGKKNHYTNREETESKKVSEPEERHWKLSAQAASPKVAVIEVAILIVCAAFAVVGVVSCLAQLPHLL
jgi:hypothetical protein